MEKCIPLTVFCVRLSQTSMSVCQKWMERERVIIFATTTSGAIIAHASKDTFSMTTKDPAQVRGKTSWSSRGMFLCVQSKEVRKLHDKVWRLELSLQHLTVLISAFRTDECNPAGHLKGKRWSQFSVLCNCLFDTFCQNKLNFRFRWITKQWQELYNDGLFLLCYKVFIWTSKMQTVVHF